MTFYYVIFSRNMSSLDNRSKGVVTINKISVYPAWWNHSSAMT